MQKFDWWVEQCRGLLVGNQVRNGRYRYTRPAPHVYEYQWLWDSCFHAITYRWFDVAMAQDELLSMVAKQVDAGADAGMIPHMNYWQPDGMALWGQAERSIITQPPLLAVAAELVYAKSGDKQFLRQMYDAVARYHAWFDRRRDPEGEHLVAVLHPWEPGCDASPRWDEPLGLNNPTAEETKAVRHGLVKRLIAHDCNAQALAQAGSFYVKTAEFNAIRAADLQALGRMASILGEHADWQTKAEQVNAAIQRQMVREEGIVDLMGWEKRPLTPSVNGITANAAHFILLFGGSVDDANAAKLVADLESDPYATPYPVSTTPTNDPLFDPNSYWRGNVWLSVNWLIYQGLRRYGYAKQASHLAQRSLALVEQHGFHEYFNPLTGQGLGPAQQSWSAIVLDMLATEVGR
ncbi:MAG: trehalase family glycosidase [Chloroflexota bacterium]